MGVSPHGAAPEKDAPELGHVTANTPVPSSWTSSPSRNLKRPLGPVVPKLGAREACPGCPPHPISTPRQRLFPASTAKVFLKTVSSELPVLPDDHGLVQTCSCRGRGAHAHTHMHTCTHACAHMHAHTPSLTTSSLIRATFRNTNLIMSHCSLKSFAGSATD